MTSGTTAVTTVTTVTTSGHTAAMLADAWAAADTAIRRARVHIRTLDTIAEMDQVRRLFDRIWGTNGSGSPVPPDLMVAMRKGGNYVSGAYDGDRLVGACLGFFAAPVQLSLHSHIAGVLPLVQGRDVGFALKVHQRAWALTRGTAEIAWTYDPLISRNAHFNLAKLGADATEYLPDFYGPIDDGINRSDPSDRLLVRWRLDSEAVAAACRGERRQSSDLRRCDPQVALEPSAEGRPVVRATDATMVLVGVPPDVEALRASEPLLAGEWRTAVRDVLGGLMADGARVRGFDRAGWYLVDKQERTRS